MNSDVLGVSGMVHGSEFGSGTPLEKANQSIALIANSNPVTPPKSNIVRLGDGEITPLYGVESGSGSDYESETSCKDAGAKDYESKTPFAMRESDLIDLLAKLQKEREFGDVGSCDNPEIISRDAELKVLLDQLQNVWKGEEDHPTPVASNAGHRFRTSEDLGISVINAMPKIFTRDGKVKERSYACANGCYEVNIIKERCGSVGVCKLCTQAVKLCAYPNCRTWFASSLKGKRCRSCRRQNRTIG